MAILGNEDLFCDFVDFFLSFSKSKGPYLMAILGNEDLFCDFVDFFLSFRSDDSWEEFALLVRESLVVFISLVVQSHKDVSVFKLLQSISQDFSGSESVVVVGVSVIFSSTEDIS